MGRHSTMVVGPTGGGKTVIIEILCMAQTYLDIHTKLYILNPKVCVCVMVFSLVSHFK